ncbi:MAG: radical SAM protein [Candidatus Sumerlaeia bacterium]
MPSRAYHYLFGPVPSRRLGRSLGIDPVPSKTCSYNCIYCQLGPTPSPTDERREWVPVDAILEEFGDWLEEDGQADVITIAGSGEPCLHIRLGEIIEGIQSLLAEKELEKKPDVCVLTNGSLLFLAEVRQDLMQADIVKATFSAASDETWQKVHGPASGISYADMVAGLRLFAKEFSGQLWIEVMLMAGINDDEDEVRKIAALLADIQPNRIQLNTPVRPPAQSTARAVEPERLEQLAAFFTPHAETPGAFRKKEASQRILTEDEIAQMIDRHPATAEQIAEAFGQDRAKVVSMLDTLVSQNRIERIEDQGKVFYRIRQK